jgi:hypothetical protein
MIMLLSWQLQLAEGAAVQLARQLLPFIPLPVQWQPVVR